MGRKRKARGGIVFIVDDFGKEDLRSGSKRARCHLLAVAHEPVEMDFRRRDERPDAAAALNETSRSRNARAWRAVIRLT